MECIGFPEIGQFLKFVIDKEIPAIICPAACKNFLRAPVEKLDQQNESRRASSAVFTLTCLAAGSLRRLAALTPTLVCEVVNASRWLAADSKYRISHAIRNFYALESGFRFLYSSPETSDNESRHIASIVVNRRLGICGS